MTRPKEMEITRWRTRAMAALLVLIAFSIFVLPALVAGNASMTWLERMVVLAILLAGVAAIQFRRIDRILAVVTVGGVVAWLLEWALASGAFGSWHAVLVLCALLVLAFALAVEVFANRRSAIDRLLSAVALYLVMALVWAAVYQLIASVVPNAFAGSLPQRATLFEWGYFSLVTLTTVGYGDITPVAHVARSCAALEAMVGQLYPAVIIARLLSLPETA